MVADAGRSGRFSLDGDQKPGVAVGTEVALRPPHRSVRAELPHTAPASGHDAKRTAEMAHPSAPTVVPADSGGRLTYAVETHRHATPALCPVRGRLSSVPLGYAPSLHGLRRAMPRCSAASSVLWAYPTSRPRRWWDYGIAFPAPPGLRRVRTRPPRSCAKGFPACSGSPTARDRLRTCD